MYLNQQSKSVCESLDQAQAYAFSGDFSQARDSVNMAYSHWKQKENRFAALTDHAPIEQIDDLFACAGEYAQLEEREEFTLLCGRIGRMVEMISQAQQLYWWSLLLLSYQRF